MLRPLRFLAWPVVLGIVLVSGMGCPPAPPNYLPAFIINPSSLDFGENTDSLKLTVAKTFTQQPLPQFTITNGGTDWLGVTPGSGNSTGPDDKAEFTVTVDRTRMDAGANSANLVVSAPGVAEQKVPVTATALLVANFSAAPLLAGVNQKVKFTDESSTAPGQGPIVDRTWDFGDGKQSKETNPTHRYKQPGTYTVTLTVQTANLVDTAVREDYITVEPAAGLDADFSGAPKNPPAGTPVKFTDLSTDGDKAVKSWFWTFGDGLNSVSTQQNPEHIYTSVGKFTVSLTVTNNKGDSDTETKTDYINVKPAGPTADFFANDRTPTPGQVVQFTDTSDEGSSPITAWFWNFGDNATSVLQNPTHIYNAAGSYTVYLSVTTDVGSDSETKQNYITVAP